MTTDETKDITEKCVQKWTWCPQCGSQTCPCCGRHIGPVYYPVYLSLPIYPTTPYVPWCGDGATSGGTTG
jgi:hypothetical protein